MKRLSKQIAMPLLMASVLLAGCNNSKNDPNAGAPPPLKVERAEDRNLFQVDRPEQFPLTAAVEHVTVSRLKATGTVNPDISRSVPVVSMAAGRVVEIKARLGDTVQKGQVLLRLQSADISIAFSDYQRSTMCRHTGPNHSLSPRGILTRWTPASMRSCFPAAPP